MDSLADRPGVGLLILLCLLGCHGTGPHGPSDSALEDRSALDTAGPTTDSGIVSETAMAIGDLDGGIDTQCSRPIENCPGDLQATGACNVRGATCSFQVGAPACGGVCTCGDDGMWAFSGVCCATIP